MVGEEAQAGDAAAAVQEAGADEADLSMAIEADPALDVEAEGGGACFWVVVAAAVDEVEAAVVGKLFHCGAMAHKEALETPGTIIVAEVGRLPMVLVVVDIRA